MSSVTRLGRQRTQHCPADLPTRVGLRDPSQVRLLLEDREKPSESSKGQRQIRGYLGAGHQRLPLEFEQQQIKLADYHCLPGQIDVVVSET